MKLHLKGKILFYPQVNKFHVKKASIPLPHKDMSNRIIAVIMGYHVLYTKLSFYFVENITAASNYN